MKQDLRELAAGVGGFFVAIVLPITVLTLALVGMGWT